MEAPTIETSVEVFINLLVRAVQFCSVYGQDHQIEKEAVEELQASFDSIMLEKDELVLGIIGGEFVYDKHPLFHLSQNKQNFIESLKDMGIEKIRFAKGTTQSELHAFVIFLNEKIHSQNKDDVKSSFELTNILHISLGDILLQEGEEGKSIDDISLFTKKSFSQSLEFLKQTVEDMKLDKPIDTDSLSHLMTCLVKSFFLNKNLLMMLTSIKLQDEDKFLHNMNVCVLTMLQCELLGVNKIYMKEIASAALLHNIGELINGKKIKKSDTVVVGEEDHYQQSLANILSAKILLTTKGLSPLPAMVAFEHNIYYNLYGYPMRLHSSDLNLITMMITIAKSYDTMRRHSEEIESGRPEYVYDDMMKQSGKQYHPDLLENFFNAIGIYPPGTLVELDTHEVGLIIQNSFLDKVRPQIQLLYNMKGEKFTHPVLTNLLERDLAGKFTRTIVKSIFPSSDYEIPLEYRS